MRIADGGLAAAATLALAACAAIPPAAPPLPPPPPPRPTAVRPPDPAPPGRFTLQGALIQGGVVLATAPPGAVSVMLDGAALPLAPGGRFLFGLDRDAAPAATLVARLADGREVRHALRVSPRAWNIQSLPTLPRGTAPTPEFTRRRTGELARIAAARARDTGAAGWQQRFAWPVTGRISGVFGSQRIYAGEPGAYHSGVDVARPSGTPVAAPADGVVILAADAPFTLEGNLLMIDHGMGLNSAFLHLSRIDVQAGDRVRQGQIVGAVGRTGRATGPHLHWSLRWRDARVDPELTVGPMPVAGGGSANTGTGSLKQ